MAFLSLGNIDWLVDRFGASVTSDLLSDVETIMAYLVRSGDAVGRLNLRCFLVILPDAKLEDATYVSNRIADVLRDTEFQIPGCADTVRLHIEASSAAWSQSIASPSPREGFVLH